MTSSSVSQDQGPVSSEYLRALGAIFEGEIESIIFFLHNILSYLILLIAIDNQMFIRLIWFKTII